MTDPVTAVVATTATQAAATTADTIASQPWWLAPDGPWWADPLATMVGIIVGAYMIFVQQRHASRAELKLQLFEKLQTDLSAASSAQLSAGMWAFSAPRNLDLYLKMVSNGQKPALPQSDTRHFYELNREAGEQVSDLVILLEGYDIVSEHFELYRMALVCTARELNDAFTAMIPLLHRTLPLYPPPGTLGQPIMPQSSDAEREAFRAACERYWALSSNISSFIHDIKIEAQNVLLGGIFTRRVPPRDPPDKTQWVLRTDDPEHLEKLKKWFMEDHPVAKHAKQLDAELRERSKGQKKQLG